MAIVITKPSSQIGISTNTNVYSMAPTFLPTANAAIVLVAHASGTVVGAVSGTGTTFSQLAFLDPQATGASFLLTEMKAPASPTSVSINVDYTGDNATGCTAAAVQLTGIEVGMAPRQVLAVSSVGPNPVVTFDNAVNSGNGVVVGIAAPGALCVFTPPAGWTTIVATYGTPTTELGVFYSASVSGLTFTFSTGAQADLAYVAAEYYYLGGAPLVLGGFDQLGMMGVFGL